MMKKIYNAHEIKTALLVVVFFAMATAVPLTVLAYDEYEYVGTSYPSTDYMGTSYSSTDYVGTSYPSNSYVGTSYPSTDYLGTSYPSASYLGTSYPSNSYVGTSYPSASYLGTSYPSTSYIGTSYPSTDFIGTSYPSTDYIGTSYPSASYLETSYPSSYTPPSYTAVPSYSSASYGYSGATYGLPTYSSGATYGSGPTYGVGATYGRATYGSGPTYGYLTYPTVVVPPVVTGPTTTTINNVDNTCAGKNNCNTTIGGNAYVYNATNPAPFVVNNNNTNPNTNTNNNSNTNNVTVSVPAPSAMQTIYVTHPTYTQSSYVPAYNTQYHACPCAIAPAANPTPYISLSAVPYTGLELGPFGLVVYWSALVLLCLGVAYFVVVRRAHVNAFRWMGEFLFGTGETVFEAATQISASHQTQQIAAPTVETFDTFLHSQIHGKFGKSPQNVFTKPSGQVSFT